MAFLSSGGNTCYEGEVGELKKVMSAMNLRDSGGGCLLFCILIARGLG